MANAALANAGGLGRLEKEPTGPALLGVGALGHDPTEHTIVILTQKHHIFVNVDLATDLAS